MSEINPPTQPKTSNPPQPSATEPSAPSQTPQPSSTESPAPENPLTFHSSAIGQRETAQTKDYFAEQNAKTSAKKLANAVRTKRILIPAGIALAVIIILAILLFIFTSKIPDAPAGYADLPEKERISRNATLADDIYANATKTGENSDKNSDENNENEGSNDVAVNSESIITNFDNAIKSSRSLLDMQIARMAKMDYLILSGDYDKIIELGKQISTDGNSACDYPGLDVSLRATCHNIMGEAYTLSETQANDELAQYHMDMTSTLIMEEMRIEGIEEGVIEDDEE